MNTKKLFSKFGLLIIAISVFLIILISDYLFKNIRIDLTQDALYTLSEGTENILDTLEKPITLHFFYSDKLTQDIPSLRNFAKRVQELLEEFELKANGNIILKVLDPEPFSEEEDQASAFGLQAIPDGKGNEIYFGLAGVNEKGKQQIIKVFEIGKEEFLEYNLIKLVYSLSLEKKIKIAMYTGLQVNPTGGGFSMMGMEGGASPWYSIKQLKQLYDLNYLPIEFKEIDPDIDVMVMIHPKQLSNDALYALDQFVLRGGKLLLFLDPFTEQAPINPGGGGSSDLGNLLENWGVEFQKDKVIGDDKYALQVSDRTGQPIRHIGLLGYSKENFDEKDIIISDLEQINFASAGSLKKIEPKNEDESQNLIFKPLIQSSNVAMLLDAKKFENLTDPNVLFENFLPTGEIYTIAARIQGIAKTSFPSPPKQEKSDIPHLTESKEDIQIVVIADTDLLSDRLWVNVQSFFGQQIAQPFANNGNLLINSVDNLIGNGDLINLRSRNQFSRPFTKVNELQQKAATTFRQQEKILKQQLQNAEQQINAIQAQKTGNDKLTLNEEQKIAIENFKKEKLNIRKKLRNVQHQLNKDIESLGNTLKLINIALIPLILTLLIVGINLFKRKKEM